MTSFGENMLLRTFGTTRHLIQKPIEARMKQEGITYSMDQIIVLMIVRHKPGFIVQQDLVDIMGKDKSVILRMVDVMEGDGLLKRVVDVHDRRRNNLELTVKGFLLLDKIFEIEDQVSKELLQGISKEDLDIFYSVVNRIQQNTQK